MITGGMEGGKGCFVAPPPPCQNIFGQKWHFYKFLFFDTYPYHSHHKDHHDPEQVNDFCKLHSGSYKGFGRLFGHFHILDIQNPCTVCCKLKY